MKIGKQFLVPLHDVCWEGLRYNLELFEVARVVQKMWPC